MTSIAVRKRSHEWMDEDDADPVNLNRSLVFIRRINTLLGYTRATLSHLQRFSKSWKRGQTIRMIDLGTGSADIPLSILRWADQRKFEVHIVGVDRHSFTASTAAQAAAGHPRLKIVQCDVLAMPFAADSFDYALTGMFLHHLDEPEAVTVLRTMDRLATRGIIAADLLRTAHAHRWIRLLTLFANPMVRHDAVASVAQSFSREEAVGLRDQAGLTYVKYHHHFGDRFVLAGEKTNGNGAAV